MKSEAEQIQISWSLGFIKFKDLLSEAEMMGSQYQSDSANKLVYYQFDDGSRCVFDLVCSSVILCRGLNDVN